MPNDYVSSIDTINFITYDGSNEVDVVAAIVGVTGAGTVTYAKISGVMYILVVNTQFGADPAYVVYRLEQQQAMRTNIPSVGNPTLPLAIIENPSLLVPYDSVYVTPPA